MVAADKPKPKASKNAALGDLREFLRQAEETGELARIAGADPDRELGALYELAHEHAYPPVLLFEAIKGCDPAFRIATCLRNSKLMVGELSLAAVQEFRKRPKEKVEPIPPREVNYGPLLETMVEGDAVDVTRFPAPLWHAQDGGRYIGTECMIVVRDPDSDWVNLGTYRVMVHDAKTLGVFIESGKDADIIRKKYWARGEACPMAISVGQAPILGMVAGNNHGHGVSEYAVAGARIGTPIDIVRGAVTGLPLPAEGELAFEGFMPPPEIESRKEGPFGEWPGYYASDHRPEPVLRVKAVYHRKDAIVTGAPPLKPTYPGRQVIVSRLAGLWDAIEAAGVPEVRGVWTMPGGGGRFIQVVAIKQLHAGHAKMAGLVAAGCGAGAYMTRLVIVVDEDVDITNAAEVMWAVATRWDPKTQTDIIDGCWTGHIDPLLPPDKREAHDTTTARMIIYAVRPFAWKDQFPKVNMVDRDYAERIRAKWQDKLAYLRKS
jgi:UbiD family decarboxylase